MNTKPVWGLPSTYEERLQRRRNERAWETFVRDDRVRIAAEAIVPQMVAVELLERGRPLAKDPGPEPKPPVPPNRSDNPDCGRYALLGKAERREAWAAYNSARDEFRAAHHAWMTAANAYRRDKLEDPAAKHTPMHRALTHVWNDNTDSLRDEHLARAFLEIF